MGFCSQFLDADDFINFLCQDKIKYGRKSFACTLRYSILSGLVKYPHQNGLPFPKQLSLSVKLFYVNLSLTQAYFVQINLVNIGFWLYDLVSNIVLLNFKINRLDKPHNPSGRSSILLSDAAKEVLHKFPIGCVVFPLLFKGN